MRHARPATQAAISLAMWPLTIIFSPVILVAGEPVNRYVMRRVRRSAAAGSAAVIRHGDGPARAVAVRLPSASLPALGGHQQSAVDRAHRTGPLGERPVPQTTLDASRHCGPMTADAVVRDPEATRANGGR
jgi:hypothetical protein